MAKCKVSRGKDFDDPGINCTLQENKIIDPRDYNSKRCRNETEIKERIIKERNLFAYNRL